MGLPRELVDRYLGALGLSRAAPSRPALDALVEAHVSRVPFENVSKLLRLRRLGLADVPPLQPFLEGVERHGLGGTCYANNTHLWSLLRSLGYDARLCGAAMGAPDVHAVVVVRLDGRELLVDAGYGAPFLSPLPLDSGDDHSVPWGHESYVLRRRDREGRSRLELWRDGSVKHGYVVDPTPRTPAHFAAAVAGSFRPGATFMNAIAIYRFDRHGSVAIRNLKLVESTPTSSSSRMLADRDELAAVAEARFGIPAGLVAEAMGQLRGLEDPWS